MSNPVHWHIAILRSRQPAPGLITRDIGRDKCMDQKLGAKWTYDCVVMVTTQFDLYIACLLECTRAGVYARETMQLLICDLSEVQLIKPFKD